MALSRRERTPKKNPPCVCCEAEGEARPDGLTWLCAKHDAEWGRHVDELVDAGKWPVGKWADVWGPWLNERRKRSAA